MKQLKLLAKYNFEDFLKKYKEQRPKSSRSPKGQSSNPDARPLNEFIEYFYMSKQGSLAPSSISNYQKKIERYITPKFGKVPVAEIKPLQIQRWLLEDLSHLSNKTVKDLVCFLNQIFLLAILDDAIMVNPLDKLKAGNVLKLKSVAPEPQPFTDDEIQKIVSTPTSRKSEINLFHFNCYTGLRLGESMALSWTDIDLAKQTLHVNRSVVNNTYKSPKNASSQRTIKLLPQAIAVLERQLQLARLKPQTLEVLTCDNKTMRKDNVCFVFYNSNTMLPFDNDNQYRQRFFQNHLKKAGVVYRGANQARHTYASHLVSAGLPLTWVARQMGHTSIKMIEKHYAKWMPTHEDKFANLASQAFS
ncbi:tyrosine-type recombinase/integrase [Thalassotalea litorea]|uniref:tyrosine-type recombinase/integrase n=1 Tax=Thalassotalea litorea TaxID=2020715 RepID=UPI0037355C9F